MIQVTLKIPNLATKDLPWPHSKVKVPTKKEEKLIDLHPFNLSVLEPTSLVSKPPHCCQTHFAGAQTISLVLNPPGWCPLQVSNPSCCCGICFVITHLTGVEPILLLLNLLRHCGTIFVVMESTLLWSNRLRRH